MSQVHVGINMKALLATQRDSKPRPLGYSNMESYPRCLNSNSTANPKKGCPYIPLVNLGIQPQGERGELYSGFPQKSVSLLNFTRCGLMQLILIT